MLESGRAMNTILLLSRKRHIATFAVIQLILLVLVFSAFRKHPEKCSPRVVCFEDAESNKQTKIGIRPLNFPLKQLGQSGNIDGAVCRNTIQPVFHSSFSVIEKEQIDKCIAHYEEDFERGHSGFWSGDTQYVRLYHHTYLNSESLLIEIGGNKGYDAEEFITKYNPGKFVILEPLKILYSELKMMFSNQSNVVLYNLGLGKKDDIFYVNYEGPQEDGQGTSQFSASMGGTCSLRVVNTTEFFIQLGVGCYEVDLLTINCEGCEYEVLESLLSTNIIRYFRNIQFATHTKLPRLRDPVRRYCEIHTLLERTHRLTYCYKFQWESWVRKGEGKQRT